MGGKGGMAGGGGGLITAEPAVPDDHLLDAATKAEIAVRARVVAEAGAIPLLVPLCAGPDGPLEDLEAKEAAKAAAAAAGLEVEEEKKKKGKKKAGGKKGKKGKLEPGQAEAQSWASAVLRMISLDVDWRAAVCGAGAIRYLLPLLDAKVHPARWNARQTLINLSMTPTLMPTLQLYKVPDYIHGANIPARHFDRPFPPTGVVDEALQAIPPHLQTAVANAQKDIAAARAGPGAKPPALKPRAPPAAG
uniref:Uncharacterized protein n=1 Tax=Chlamydomonas leiostraca TaxID=1034604 RepID=A0A7S0S1C1_9CHLO|mmetsp:Transcript_38137/g.96480  ORF Transcript_38137/g.96480 Transcript_38137/m.96480 type:complete len:248 (+) Transcript_38137:1-744(+)